MNTISSYMPLCFKIYKSITDKNDIEIICTNELVSLLPGDINFLTGELINKPITEFDIIHSADVFYISDKEQLAYLINEMGFKVKECFALAPMYAIYIVYIATSCENPLWRYVISTEYAKSHMMNDNLSISNVENLESKVIDYISNNRISLGRD